VPAMSDRAGTPGAAVRARAVGVERRPELVSTLRDPICSIEQ
jgi:hypothetical protein